MSPEQIEVSAESRPGPGRPRDPELEARRKAQILDVAARVFAAHGFANTHVQTIANHVGVGNGTVYRYFPTKDQLFLATVERGLQELTAEMDRVLDSPREPLEILAEAIRTYLAFFHRRPEMAELFIQERAAFPHHHRPLYFATQEDSEQSCKRAAFFQRLMQTGLVRPMPFERLFAVVGDLLYGTILTNLMSGRAADPEAQARDMVDVILNGILAKNANDGGEEMTFIKPTIAAQRGLLLLLPLLVLVPACAPRSPSSATNAEAHPVPVTVAAVKAIRLPRTVPVVGTLHATEDVQLAPKIDGRVARILKDVGDTVVPGEVLMELDPTDYRLVVAQARPAFEAELKKLKLEDLPKTDAAFTAHLPLVDAVAQARANLELAQKELARTEFENSKGVGSGQVLDSARTKVKVAETAVELARTDARVTLANARRLKAALEDAEEKLRETELRAPPRPEWTAWSAVLGAAANPMRYSVATRMVSKGEMIRQMPVTNAYRLVLDHILKLRVTVPEKFKPEVHVGQPVAVHVEAYPDQTFSGTVSRINPTVDTVNRTFMAEIEVPNFSRRLSAGGFAQAEIRTRTDTGIRTVPPEAIVSFAGVTKVFVVDGDKAHAVEVEIGTREKDWVEIRGDLKPDAKVITSGQSQLVEGSPIRVR